MKRSADPVEWVSAALVVALTLVVVLQVFNRFVLQTPLAWSEDLAMLLFHSMAFDPVHFGVLVIAIVGISIVAPPIGLCLVIICSLVRIKLTDTIRPLTPYTAILVVDLLVIASGRGWSSSCPASSTSDPATRRPGRVRVLYRTTQTYLETRTDVTSIQ